MAAWNQRQAVGWARQGAPQGTGYHPGAQHMPLPARAHLPLDLWSALHSSFCIPPTPWLQPQLLGVCARRCSACSLACQHTQDGAGGLRLPKQLVPVCTHGDSSPGVFTTDWEQSSSCPVTHGDVLDRPNVSHAVLAASLGPGLLLAILAGPCSSGTDLEPCSYPKTLFPVRSDKAASLHPPQFVLPLQMLPLLQKIPDPGLPRSR